MNGKWIIPIIPIYVSYVDNNAAEYKEQAEHILDNFLMENYTNDLKH